MERKTLQYLSVTGGKTGYADFRIFQRPLPHRKCRGSVVGFDRSVRGTRRFLFTATHEKRRSYGTDPSAGCHLQAGERGPHRRLEHARKAQLRYSVQPDPRRLYGAHLSRQPQGRRDPGTQGLPGHRCDPGARGHGRRRHPSPDGHGGHRGVRQGRREIRSRHHGRLCRGGRGRRKAPGGTGPGRQGVQRPDRRAQLPGGEHPLQQSLRVLAAHRDEGPDRLRLPERNGGRGPHRLVKRRAPGIQRLRQPRQPGRRGRVGLHPLLQRRSQHEGHRLLHRGREAARRIPRRAGAGNQTHCDPQVGQDGKGPCGGRKPHEIACRKRRDLPGHLQEIWSLPGRQPGGALRLRQGPRLYGQAERQAPAHDLKLGRRRDPRHRRGREVRSRGSLPDGGAQGAAPGVSALPLRPDQPHRPHRRCHHGSQPLLEDDRRGEVRLRHERRHFRRSRSRRIGHRDGAGRARSFTAAAPTWSARRPSRCTRRASPSIPRPSGA